MDKDYKDALLRSLTYLTAEVGSTNDKHNNLAHLTVSVINALGRRGLFTNEELEGFQAIIDD